MATNELLRILAGASIDYYRDGDENALLAIKSTVRDLIRIRDALEVGARPEDIAAHFLTTPEVVREVGALHLDY